MVFATASILLGYTTLDTVGELLGALDGKEDIG
jgi:hypothetical protein